MTIVLVLGIALFVLDKMNVDMKIYYKQTCDEMNGTLITYSGSNCDNCKLGGTYCKVNNGTEVDITIRNVSSS